MSRCASYTHTHTHSLSLSLSLALSLSLSLSLSHAHTHAHSVSHVEVLNEQVRELQRALDHANKAHAPCADMLSELREARAAFVEVEQTKDAQIRALKANLAKLDAQLADELQKEDALERSLAEEKRKEEELTNMLDMRTKTLAQTEGELKIAKEQMASRQDVHNSSGSTSNGIARPEARVRASRPLQGHLETSELHADIVNFLSKSDAVVVSPREITGRQRRGAAAIKPAPEAADFVPVWRAPSSPAAKAALSNALAEARLELMTSRELSGEGELAGASSFVSVWNKESKPASSAARLQSDGGGVRDGRNSYNGFAANSQGGREQFVTVWQEEASLQAGSGGGRKAAHGLEGDEFVTVWNRGS
jgi:hypothetical protein